MAVSSFGHAMAVHAGLPVRSDQAAHAGIKADHSTSRVSIRMVLLSVL